MRSLSHLSNQISKLETKLCELAPPNPPTHPYGDVSGSRYWRSEEDYVEWNRAFVKAIHGGSWDHCHKLEEKHAISVNNGQSDNESDNECYTPQWILDGIFKKEEIV